MPRTDKSHRQAQRIPQSPSASASTSQAESAGPTNTPKLPVQMPQTPQDVNERQNLYCYVYFIKFIIDNESLWVYDFNILNSAMMQIRHCAVCVFRWESSPGLQRRDGEGRFAFHPDTAPLGKSSGAMTLSAQKQQTAKSAAGEYDLAHRPDESIPIYYRFMKK